MPKTKLGKWSVGLIIGCFLLIAIFILGMIVSGPGPDTLTFKEIFDMPGFLFLISLVLGAICGISAFFTGLISIIKSKERAVLVFLTTVAGLYILFLFVGELLSMVGILPSH